MRNVTSVIGFTGYASERIGSAQLGVNMLFHTDRTTRDSDFSRVVEEVGASFIRYPGGTIAEQFFDISNPNSSHQPNILDIITSASSIQFREVTPLREYLLYMQEISGTPIIVLPTYRFFNHQSGELLATAEETIRDFVRNLVGDNYGHVDNVVLELGNEWYQSHFDWSIEQFGQLQATIASWIDDELTGLEERHNITLLAQTGRSAEENEIFSSFFIESESIIDGVLTHLYGTNSNGNPLGIGGGINNRLETINAIWGPILEEGFNLAVTEWNVGESGEDSTLINGIMRFAPLMRIFGEMISNGVDLAMIWSTQTKGPAGLSGREGEGSNLSPTGYFYSILSNSIEGMQLVETGTSAHLVDAEGNPVGYTYTFEANDNVVSYFVSGIAQNIELKIDMTNYIVEGAYVFATILGAVPGESGTEYWSGASVQYLTGLDLTNNGGGEWLFEHQLSPYEVLELQVIVGEGITIIGDTQNAISDHFIGSDFADTLVGNLGDDTILGNSGGDNLEGGAGSDLLSGGADHDVLQGGAGDDTLLGEHGCDYLNGGVGSDFLDGGNWHDTLVGAAGTDTLIGGDGNDFLSMGNGGGIAEGGLGEDTLSFQDAAESVTIWAYSGVVEVRMETVEFTGIEVFQGSQYDDRISIIGEGRSYFSGEGNDTIEIVDGAENTVYMEDGDDFIFIYHGRDGQFFGGAGDDHFVAYDGGSLLDGGTGNDTFGLYNTEQDILEFQDGDGADIVYGFQSGVDQIVFRELSRGSLSITEVRAGFGNLFGTMLDFDDAGSIFLVNYIGTDIGNDIFFV